MAPSWGVVWLPALILLTLVATLGLGITLAALTVFYRDFKHIVPFLVQILMYVTPVIYPMSMIGPALAVGPVAQPDVRDHRRVSLGDPRAALGTRGRWRSPRRRPSALFMFSLFYFRKTERQFADFA